MNSWRTLGIVATLTVLGASCSRTATGEGAGPTVNTEVPRDNSTFATSTSQPGLIGGGPGESVQPYETFNDCDGFLTWTKDELLKRVTPWGINRYGWDPNSTIETAQPASDEAPPASEAPAAEAPEDVAPTAPESTPAPAGGTSTTNTQEVGVDESDVSETDGRFVYSIIDNVLRSVDLETSQVVYEQPLTDAALSIQPEMILFGPTLLVSHTNWSSSGTETELIRYSISNGVPTFVGTDHLEGELLSVRAIDGIARVTMTTSLLPRIDFVEPLYISTDAEGEPAQRAIETNRKIINELTLDDLLPRRYAGTGGDTRGNVETALPCDVIGHPGEFAGFGMTWVASLDLNDPNAAPAGSGGIVADGQTVYVSPTNLYLAGQTGLWPEVVDGVVPVQSPDPATALHMFSLADPTRTNYVASGTVAGTLLNSYSMSEFEGHLRVTTTEFSTDFGGGQDSGVHIFRQSAEDLTEVGAVRGLGREEMVQAVRFHGPRAYVVTFRQTDPLFVLDLSDPTSPKLSGELKIPGYSSYLHPIDGDLLLGVGFSGSDSGLNGGTQLSLFDVSDPSNPTQISTVQLTGVTEAAFDPHAFLWWPETSDVVIPQEMSCQFGQRDECSTALVVHVDLANRSMTESARLFQWFPIRRSMVANGDLLTLSAGGLKQWSFADFSELADIRFDIPGTTAEDTLP
jgi:Beta propeller domain